MPQQTATRTDAAKKKMKQERKYQITGIAIALALHIGAGVAMYYSYLSSLATEEQPLPSAKSEITFGGEYVQLGDLPLPDLDDGIASEALSTEETTTTQADNATGDGEALVSSNADSPLAAPSQDGGDAARRQAELRKEKANIDNRTSSAFNRGGDGQGQSGSPDGNASFGALQGTPGHNLGENYHLQVQRPTCPKSGTLRISIVVRRDGTVKEARYVSGTGEAAADASIRKQFEDFTKKLRFTVSGNAPAEKRGTITWAIK